MPNPLRGHPPNGLDNVGAAARRRVLLVAYYFPPVGGGGAQRPLKLARYLPDSGWDVEILTGPGAVADRWSPHDETLLTELEPDVTIHRLAGPEAINSRRREVTERWLKIDAPWSAWWSRCVRDEALGVAAGADAIVATMPPYQTAPAAASVSKLLGIPWIADLRDPWAFDEMALYATGLHRRLELRRMRRLLSTAGAVVTTTPELAQRIADAFPELTARPIASIPNGFDATDFTRPVPMRTEGAFRIVHTGTFHTDLGRRQRTSGLRRRIVGGDVRGTDILPRSQVFLLEAIDRLLRRDGYPPSGIELHLAGVASASDREIAQRSAIVRLHGHVSHAEAIDLIRSADLLFLPMQNMPPGVRATIVPGKTYEYLASQRPILAAVPEGDTRDILLEAGTAHICDPDDVEAMVSAIEVELARHRTGEAPPRASQEFLERFERRSIAASYGELLDAVVGTGFA